MNLAGHGACIFLCVIGGAYSTWLLWDCWRQFRSPGGSSKTAADSRQSVIATQVNRVCQAVVAGTFLIVAVGVLIAIAEQNRPVVANLWTVGREEVRFPGVRALQSRRLVYARNLPDRPIVGVDLAGLAVTDAEVRALLQHVPSIQWLTLTGTEVTDECLSDIKKLPGVTSINVCFAGITDEGLKHVAGMENLERLSLDGTGITDDGLKHVAGLKCLSYLSLNETAITDDGLKYLVGLKSLRCLSLRGTAITDSGLVSLEQFSVLEDLNVDGTGVTRRGVEQLTRQLPYLVLSGIPYDSHSAPIQSP